MESSGVSALRPLLDLAAQYGIQVVLCFVMIIMFGLILRFVFRFMDRLINDTLNKVTSNLQSLTESNNAAHANHILMFERISKDIKDGFDRMNDGNKFQRDEHKEMIENIRRNRELFECKAK